MAEVSLKEQMRGDFQEQRARRRGVDQTAEGLHLGQRELEMEMRASGPEKGEELPKPPTEPIGEKSKRLRLDLEKKRKIFAKQDADRSETWKKIARTLGIPVSEKKGEEIEMAEKDYYESLWKYIEAEKESMPAEEKEAARVLLKNVCLGEVTMLKSLKEDEIADLQKGKSKGWNKCIDKYKQAVGWWRDLSWKKKLAYSGVMIGLGISGAGASFTAVAASIFGAKLATRLLSMPLTYAGAKKWQDTLDVGEMEYMVNLKINDILDKDDWGNRIKDLVKERKSKLESADLTNKRRAVFLASVLPVIGTAVDVYRWGFAGFSGRTVGQQPSEALYTKGPDGKIVLTPKGIESIGNSPPQTVELSPADKEMLQNISSVPEPEAKSGVVIKEAAKGPVTGAEVQTPEITKAQFEEIAAPKIGEGGTMWGSIEKSIQANPSAYGLDPNDPGFTKDMRRMTKQMLDEFASRKGMTYEELDQLARMKVRPGDTLKIVYNPGAEELHLEYEGKAFGADVSQAAPTEGISSGRPQVAPEEMKVKTGEAEYPAQKSASQIKGMEEIEADYRKDLADRGYARAVRAEKDLSILHERQAAHLENVGQETNLRQMLATRGLLNRVIEGAGIGNNVSFWEGSALNWYDQVVNKENYIVGDIHRADIVEKLNLNLEKLRELFLKLNKPEIGQSMNDYLKKAMENPRNVEAINQIISGK